MSETDSGPAAGDPQLALDAEGLNDLARVLLAALDERDKAAEAEARSRAGMEAARRRVREQHAEFDRLLAEFDRLPAEFHGRPPPDGAVPAPPGSGRSAGAPAAAPAR
jgi:hypothetical protein